MGNSKHILNENSPSVQTHLGILQGVIERMASNSTFAKAWCITIVSAILVVVADKSKPQYALIAVVPTVLFGGLDVYYLALEKGFRNTYNEFVKRLHDSSLTPDDLYFVKPSGNISRLQFESMKSFSVWGFYAGLLLLVIMAWLLLLK